MEEGGTGAHRGFQLEERTKRAFERKGYRVLSQTRIRSKEYDLIAVREEGTEFEIKILVECKSTAKGAVNVETVRTFIGAVLPLFHSGEATRAMLVSDGSFSPAAQEAASTHGGVSLRTITELEEWAAHDGQSTEARTKVFVACEVPDDPYIASLKTKFERVGIDLLSNFDAASVGERFADGLARAAAEADIIVIYLTPFYASNLRDKPGSLDMLSSLGKPLVLARVEGATLLGAYSVSYRFDLLKDDADSFVEQVQYFALAERNQRQRSAVVRKEAVQEIRENYAYSLKVPLSDLAGRERRNSWIAVVWQLGGIACLAMAAWMAWTLLARSDADTLKQAASPIAVGVLALRGLMVLALLVGASKYCFELGKSFMTEALRCADRRHAISYGQFYMTAFGSTATPSEIKEVFQNWNIDNPSQFSKLSSTDFDPKILSALTDLAKAFNPAGKGSEEKDKK